MAKYIIKRIIWMIFVIVGVVALIFLLLSMVPGDPARLILGNEASVELVEAKRTELGLNDALVVRMLRYMKDVFTKLDFGTSYYNSVPIISEIAERMPRTLLIAAAAMAITLLIGLPLGVAAAVYQNGVIDRLCMLISMIGVAVPEFCVAMVLISIFSTKLRWLPSHGITSIAGYILPVLAISLASVAGLARIARNSTLEAIRSDYVTTARAKGVSEWNVIVHHVLPNSLIPVVTSLGGSFASSLGGTIVIENVFSIPGMGQYIVNAINSRDYNVIQGSVIVLAVFFGVIMLIVDLIYAAIDPRIKAQYLSASKRRKTI